MYEALYRKYRPQTFDDVVGQEHITETLKQQILTGRLSHAYLFVGTRGTGKTTCARILAKAVNCEHPVNGNPCLVCDSCKAMEAGELIDVTELDAASNNGVDDVRMLRDEAVFSPVRAKKRVYIIDEVHMLSKQAFNALLKILEEPPEHLMFILATTELNKVLPTILSRCQRHSFRRLDPETVASRLQYIAESEGLKLSDEAALLLGRLADGGMRDGISLLDQCASGQTIDRDTVLSAMGLMGSTFTAELADRLINRDTESALLFFRQMWNEGKDPVALLGELASFYRDALMLRLAPNGGSVLLSGLYDASDLHHASGSNGDLLNSLNIIERYLSSLKDAANPRLEVELCLIELSGLDTVQRSAGPAEHQEEKRSYQAKIKKAENNTSLPSAMSPAVHKTHTKEKPSAEEKQPPLEKDTMRGEENPPWDNGSSASESVPGEKKLTSVFVELPEAEESPYVFEEAPVEEEPPYVFEETPAEEEPPYVFEETPAEEEPPYVFEETPAEEEPPYVFEETPADEDLPYVSDGFPSDERSALPEDIHPAGENVGQMSWTSIIAALSEKLNDEGIMTLLTDDFAVSGNWENGEFIMQVMPGFYMNMLNTPQVTEAISSVCGAPVHVREYRSPAEMREDKLNALGAFDIVKFQ